MKEIIERKDAPMSDEKIKQAEDALLESLNQPGSYETDGEKITQLDPEKRLAVIERVKKSRRKNPLAGLGIFKVSTQGPER